MGKSVFGGYNKPDFGVKNITSDMWEPITTSNNFSAYTPERPVEQKKNTFSSGIRQNDAKKTAQQSTERATVDKRFQSQKSEKRVPEKKTPLKKTVRKGNTDTKTAASDSNPRQEDRTISSGRVPVKQKKKVKSPSKRQLNLREKRRCKTNKAYVKLIKSGKTADQARVILARKKIRLGRIRTLGTVAFFFVFALSFMLSYSYYQGAEIAEILIDGDEVYSDTEILEAAKLSPGMKMLTVREKKVNSDVTTLLPFVSHIAVDYRLPDTLALNIVSTRESLILKCEKKYICVDKTGKVVSDKKKKLSEGQFLVQGLTEQEYTVGESFKVSDENAKKYKIACDFAKITENADTLNYGVLDLKDLKNITFTYRSKIRLYLGDADNLESKLDSAIRIMNSAEIGDKTGYINLKYDIGAYFMEGSMK